VRVLVHWQDDEDAPAHRRRDYTDWPVRVELDEPLDERAVIDFDRDQELLLYKPPYLNNVRQPDHGSHHVGRRRAASGRSHAEAATRPPEDLDRATATTSAEPRVGRQQGDLAALESASDPELTLVEGAHPSSPRASGR
jgi:hypothetical protein